MSWTLSRSTDRFPRGDHGWQAGEVEIGIDDQLRRVLKRAYDIEPTRLVRIDAGTATDNYAAWDGGVPRWFVKVYRDDEGLIGERHAIELADFARAGGVPVPDLYRATNGELLGRAEGIVMSVWAFVVDAVTAEVGLTGKRWASVGAVLGRLHRRLARHPAANTSRQPATGLRDIDASKLRFEWLIDQYRARSSLDDFERWALGAAQERCALLPRVGAILAGLPDLTTQILHGDLASPNLLLRGDEVAAVIDFQPPAPGYVSWEIARIACDPRTVVLGDEWPAGLADLLGSYHDQNPSMPIDDLAAVLAVGCAYTISSSYPLAEPIENPARMNPSLRRYAELRHEAAVRMLAELDRGGMGTGQDGRRPSR